MQDLTVDEIHLILASAKQFKNAMQSNSNDAAMAQLLRHKVIAHCFFEPSTRTRLSFESASLRLGGNVIGFSNSEGLSIQKGESLKDTMRVIAEYADLLIIRHPKEGAARLTAEVSRKPVINAGDGANQHPTQALIDLFTILESQHTLQQLSIALVGDLKYSRTIHSFVQALMHFDVRLYLVAQDFLSLPESVCDALKYNSIRFSLHRSIDEILPKIDILYMTRLQKERFNATELSHYKKSAMINPEQLAFAKPNLKILHPLPRNDEIDVAIDSTSFADYFNQAANGLFVRQALLSLMLNR